MLNSVRIISLAVALLTAALAVHASELDDAEGFLRKIGVVQPNPSTAGNLTRYEGIIYLARLGRHFCEEQLTVASLRDMIESDPKLQDMLRGRSGPAGPQGMAGMPGPAGPPGAPGPGTEEVRQLRTTVQQLQEKVDSQAATIDALRNAYVELLKRVDPTAVPDPALAPPADAPAQ